jgi:hypothetical protein
MGPDIDLSIQHIYAALTLALQKVDLGFFSN